MFFFTLWILCQLIFSMQWMITIWWFLLTVGDHIPCMYTSTYHLHVLHPWQHFLCLTNIQTKLYVLKPHHVELSLSDVYWFDSSTFLCNIRRESFAFMLVTALGVQAWTFRVEIHWSQKCIYLMSCPVLSFPFLLDKYSRRTYFLVEKSYCVRSTKSHLLRGNFENSMKFDHWNL